MKNLNEQAACFVVPIGRHSTTNGVALAGGRLDDEGAIDDFVARTLELANNAERLEAWTREIVRRNTAT